MVELLGIAIQVSCSYKYNSAPCSSFNNTESDFIRMAKDVFVRKPDDAWRMMAIMTPIAKDLMKLFRIPVMKPKETEFFAEVVRKTLRQRMETKVRVTASANRSNSINCLSIRICLIKGEPNWNVWCGFRDRKLAN
jgi:hypothetical protein